MISWLREIRIPRYIDCSTGCGYFLCGFSDASEKGYTAIVYLRVTDPSGVTDKFLLDAKTKLAPMKSTTIPRLDLSGAPRTVAGEFQANLGESAVLSDVCAWSDSSIVLSWLYNPNKSIKTFVSNRIFQIQSTVPDCSWKHVRSENNPADCVSRGLSPFELRKCKLYWKGPSFLKSPIDSWSQKIACLGLEKLLETKQISLLIREAPPGEWFVRFFSFH